MIQKAAKGAVTKKKPAAPRKSVAVRKPATKAKPATGQVLQELKTLAKELNKAAKGLGKAQATDPKAISSILAQVERMTSDAANKSLMEAEAAKQVIGATNDSLAKDWSRKEIEASLKVVGGHLTNIIVAQEFQDLAGQAIRKAMKALVGAIVVEASAADDKKLSQTEADALMRELMP